VRFDRLLVNQSFYSSFCALVNATASNCAVNECSCLATVESEELVGVAFDFLLGNFLDAFGYFLLIVLRGSSIM
jgi:hypothetical protein